MRVLSCSSSPQFEDIRARFAARGQAHVFRFWHLLDEPARRRLLNQTARLDLDAALRGFEAIQIRAAQPGPRLEPLDVLRLPAHGGDPERWRVAREAGAEALAAGRVAALVVAGGQASRLGFDGPKGAFPIGPVGTRSLFRLQAEKLRYLRVRYGVALPWYVMTSEATDAATRAAFEAESYFGLPREDVFLFRQRMLPALDFEGRLLLDRPDHVFESPDGHGGLIPALAASGALDDLTARGCSQLFTYQVDNPLVRIAEAVYLGLHAGAGAEVSCKVIAKREPFEKVGHVARVNGRPGIVEYTEIDAAARDARDASGELRFWAGGISIYVFETSFLRRVAAVGEPALPLHASAKRIPTLDSEARPQSPSAPNGWKLERFVFDAIPHAESVAVVETGRDEYSPVKNADGGESPRTARQDLSALYRRWLHEAGVDAPPEDALVEIDQSIFDGPDDFRARGIHRAAQAVDAIRIASGARP